MDQLPAPLAPFAKWDQFILWMLEGDNKVPIDYRTGERTSAHDPTAWMPADIAFQWAAYRGPAYGVAFVFTEHDPFFFLDIDKCAADGTWSDTANLMLQWFAGAAVEVSQSGRGLHVFGTGACPEHCCKNGPLGLELYTEARFVALTGISAQGDAAHDCSAALAQVVPYYFPPKTADAAAVWTSEPVSQWRGPTDDDELIRKALASRSAASAFGEGVSFAQLWATDADALGRAYPDEHRAYDASSADAALAQHLAFWTGNDCARISRLMQRSALVRDKWQREDYLPRTILRAHSLQTRFYGTEQPAAAVVAERPEGAAALRGGTGAQRKQAEAARAAALKAAGPGEQWDMLCAVGPARTTGFWVANAGCPVEELVAAVTPAATTRTLITKSVLVTGYQYIAAEAQLQHFAGCVYVQHDSRILTPTGAHLRPEQFDAMYGGFVFQLDELGHTTKRPWEAFTQSQCVRHPRAECTVFRPQRPPGEIQIECGRITCNAYVPIDTRRVQGDPAPFLDILRRVLPDQRDQVILLSYMAACVQHKGVKFQWAPLLQGVEGNGKTLFTRCLSYAVGRPYTHYPNAKDLDNRFNAWLEGKLFIGVEDVYVAESRREVLEVLKPMITGGDGIEIQGKGADQVTVDVCANFLFNSNHADAIRKTRNDRRFCVFFTAQQQVFDLERDGMGGDYFPDLYDWLYGDGYAIVNELLHSYPIPDEFNPATRCHRAPQTSTTNEAVAASLGLVEQEVLEAIAEGRPGFAGGWVASHALKELLSGLRRTVPPRRYRELLRTLGYDWHPALRDGRVHNPLPTGGGRVRLFVRQEAPDAALTEPAQVVGAYLTAQERAATGN
jgi:hypothetical protein